MDQVEPMGTDIREGSQRATFVGNHSPIKIGRFVQPILDIATAYMKNVTDVSASNAFGCFDADWVKADRLDPHSPMKFVLNI